MRLMQQSPQKPYVYFIRLYTIALDPRWSADCMFFSPQPAQAGNPPQYSINLSTSGYNTGATINVIGDFDLNVQLGVANDEVKLSFVPDNSFVDVRTGGGDDVVMAGGSLLGA